MNKSIFLTVLVVLLSVGSIRARIGETREGYVSPEVADSAFQSEKGDQPTDRVHIEHLDVREDSGNDEADGDKTEDKLLAAEKILQEVYAERSGISAITISSNSG